MTTVPESSVLTGWRKSSYSNGDGAACVEVAHLHVGLLPVRDSKNPHGPALLIPAHAWADFIDEIKARPGL
ncbi:DUF397 domain-containing protein [Streptomyces sp. NBC_00690]|uniref:DUF397 domain-containing protein n=1 Tax=Streptomyces sp. NBC_00690 TaxID=2975808 RepID=UPI002E29EFE8|nr:DUF397 domain-containing protein [Streptomyces sp. NBC_00690]